MRAGGVPQVTAMTRAALVFLRSQYHSSVQTLTTWVAAAQENLRQLCVFKEANQSGQPWQWWDYVTRFADECKMSEQNYNEECAEKARPLHRAYSLFPVP